MLQYKKLDRKLRNNQQRCSIKKAVFKTFVRFIQKNLWWSVFFNKIAGKAFNGIKIKPQRRCFIVNIVKLFRTPILKKHLLTVTSENWAHGSFFRVYLEFRFSERFDSDSKFIGLISFLWTKFLSCSKYKKSL